MSTRTSETSEKFAISLPRSLVNQMEKYRKSLGESRSSFIQRAIRLFMEAHARKSKIEQYVQGYSANPETQAEIEAAEAAATYLLSEEPWE